MSQLDRRSLLILLAVAVTVSPLPAARDHSHRDTHSTPAGEERTIALSANSSMRLYGSTRTTVITTGTSIEVTLIEGGALFDVKHDDSRTLTVITPRGTVEDYGTQFEVLIQGDEDQISVLEGEVWAKGKHSNETAKLTAATRSRMSNRGVFILPPQTTLYGPATSAIVKHSYKHISLAAVAEVVNRESLTWRFVVDEPAREMVFRGQFVSAEQFLAGLKADPALRVTQHGHIVQITDQRH